MGNFFYRNTTFHVSCIWVAWEFWPYLNNLYQKNFFETLNDWKIWIKKLNSVITFDSELVDSHSSMNHSQGIFTVPLNGTYQFSFYADIVTSETAVIFVHLNDKVVKKFQFFGSNLNDKEILQRSIHFGLTLSQGDSVKMVNGPDAHSLLALHNPIQFIGVLVNKS